MLHAFPYALLDLLCRCGRQETAQVGRDADGHQAYRPAQVEPGSLDVGARVILHIKNEVGEHEKAQSYTNQQQARSACSPLACSSLVAQQQNNTPTEPRLISSLTFPLHNINNIPP